MNTSGFYKIDPSGELLYGPNFVLNANYELRRETKDLHMPISTTFQKILNWFSAEAPKYPIDGWYWFDSEEEAKAFLGIND